MIKIFISTFFILEVIVALAIIVELCKFDYKIVCLEKKFAAGQDSLKLAFLELRLAISRFNKTLNTIMSLISKKRKEIALGTTRQILIFLGIFFLKDKYKKRFLFLNIMLDVYEEVKNEIQTA